MKIRKLKSNDIAVVVELWYDTSVQAHNFISSEYWEENKEAMANVYLPNSETYLAIRNDNIDGFISMVDNFLAALFVKTNIQGKGVGKKLLNYIKERRETIQLKVYKKNSNSCNFYKKQDFKILSENNDDNTNEIEILMEWKKERKIILYIATSSDGFIARENGSVDWLDKYNDTGYDYGFDEFNKRFETVIVGNTTQKQYPNKYDGKPCYVFSKTPHDTDENLIYVSGDVNKFIEETNPKGNIWLVGGADLANQFIQYELIDEYIITIMPEDLGSGISLFKESNYITKLKTVETKKFGDVIQLIYSK